MALSKHRAAQSTEPPKARSRPKHGAAALLKDGAVAIDQTFTTPPFA